MTRRERSFPARWALLAAAALLLAPGEARAVSECGSAIHLPITCTDTSYPDGIFYGGSDDNNHPRGNGPINVAGSSTATTTITSTSRMVVSGGTTTTSPSVGIYVYGLGGSRQWNDLNVGVTVDSMGEMTDAGHVVNIVQGTSTNNAADRNNGIYFQHRNQMGDSTVRVGRGVTIGSETTPMQQNGIFYHPRGLSSWGAGKATLISAATIFAAKQGIRLFRNPSNVYHPSFMRISDTSITNSGAIRSGEEGVYLYFAGPAGGAIHLGDATITNTGAITVSGAKYGIFMDYRGYGATEIDNAGTIAAATGSGIHLAHNNNGAATLTNRGAVDAATVGLRLGKYNGAGTVTFTNSGRVTVTADAAAGVGHALWLWEGGLATGGPATITNRGVLSSENHALFAEISPANAAALTLTNSGAVASEDGDGIRLARGVEGDVTFANGGTSTTGGDVSGRWHGVYVGKAARIDFDQTAGTISGRTGVYLEVTRENAMGDTRTEDADGNHVPAIDVDWTRGSIARGTAENDRGRFRAATAEQALSFDQESAAGKALEGTLHYGGPAGIEVHALSWRDVAAQVAKGDDPGAFADNAAQMAAVPTGATASNNDYVKQFRAALENADLAVATPVLTAIGTTATTAVSQLTDTQIVTYLQTNDADTRILLRNVLAQGLSDKEKAVLRAVATGDATALTSALNDADAGFPSDYKAAVQALLERYNVDDIRIAMTAGSIDSRGDGIRAYYATPHDDNGAISVTVADGVTVIGAVAGIYAANAGAMGTGNDRILKQTVTVNGTVTGGTDAAVYLAGGGTLTVGETGKVHAGSSGRAIRAGGRAVVRIDGEVRGGHGDAAPAVHLEGGGSRLTVGPTGRVALNDGAALAIQRDGTETELIVVQDPDLALEGGGFTRTSVEDAIERLGGTVGGEGDGDIEVAAGEPRPPNIPSVVLTLPEDGTALKPDNSRYGELPAARDLDPESGDVVKDLNKENVPAIKVISRDAYNIVVNVPAGRGVRSTGHHGIHAYYAALGENNGSISVTVAAGATVSGGMAGIYLANAGGDVTVESAGTVGAGTDGIRVVKPGTSGDIAITAAGGEIDADVGDGIRAYYATPHDDNGAIEVTVAAGTSVTGGRAGIHVENAGLDAGGPGTADDLLKQTVTVNGTVTGGTDAAVHLVGGGTLEIGEMGKVHAGSSGRAILVNDPGRSVIRIHGEVKGGAGADAAVDVSGGGSITVGPTGSVNANGANSAIIVRQGTTEVAIYTADAVGAMLNKKGILDAIARVRGGFDTGAGGTIVDRDGDHQVTYAVAIVETDGDFTTGRYLPLNLDSEGEPIAIGDPRFEGLRDCPDAKDKLENGECVPGGNGNVDDNGGNVGVPVDCARMGESCRLYEALPSALLAMNGLPTYGERMAAARDGNGGWARIDGASGEWKGKSSTPSTPPDAAFDYRRYGVRAGVDFAVGNDGRFGVSVRGLQGSAEIAGAGGEIELSGVGAGAHGTAFLGGGFHVDAQAMATWYGVKLTASQRDIQGEMRKRVLKDGAKALGLALRVEVGRRTDMGGGLTVTPGAGLSWSEVDLSFARSVNERVSVEDARSLVGRAGLRVEMEDGFRLFGSVEATHEFSDRRSARISGAQVASTPLSATEAEKTGFRLGAGGARSWEDGRYALRASAGYAARGIGNGEFDGGISLAMRF